MLLVLGMAAPRQVPIWLVPGMLSLAPFAYLLTFVDSDAAGRAYAAYGGVYLVASIALLWMSREVGRIDGTSQGHSSVSSEAQSYCWDPATLEPLPRRLTTAIGASET